MKKSKLLVVSGVALASLLTMVGCGGGSSETPEELVNRVSSEVKVGYASFKEGIRVNQSLQTSVDGVSITYTETSEYLTISADGTTLEVNVPYFGDKITVDGAEVTVTGEWSVMTTVVATFTYKGVTVTENIGVLLVATPKVMSYDAYIAAKKDDAACVQVVIDRIGLERKYNYQLAWGHDATGNSYYIYNAGKDSMGENKIAVGNEVIITGTKDVYNGFHELIKCDSVTLVSQNNTTITTPTDITSVLTATSDMASNDLVKYQGAYVKATGLVVTNIEKGTWVEADEEEGKEAYGEKYFLDVTAGETGKEFTIGICRSAANAAELWASLEAIKVDDVITVEGYGSWYNLFNITLVDNQVTVTGSVTKTNQQKIDLSKTAIEEDLPETVGADFELPVVGIYDGVSVSWTSSNTSVISVDTEGKATVIGGATEQKVTLTGSVTIAGGSETATITHEVTVPAVTNSTILNARNMYSDSDVTNVTVEGTVTAVQGTSYYIDDGYSSLFIYNHSNHGYVVGDTITYTGTLTTYNGLYQMKNKTASSKLTDKTITPREVLTVTESTFDATTLAGEDGRMVKAEGLVFVKVNKGPWVYGKDGTTAQYTFKLGNKEITLTLNKYANDGADVAALVEGLTAGDVIDVTAPIGWYKGPQIDLTHVSQITKK